MGKRFDAIVEDLTSLGYDFRMNELDNSIEVFTANNWQMIDDTIEPIIRTELRELRYGTRKKPSMATVEDAWKTLAYQKRYNPVKDFFTGLAGHYEPSGDGPYIVQGFSKFFNNPDGMFSTWLFRWMTGAINKVLGGGRNPMLLLAGPQDKGKSRLARWLCPLDEETYFMEKGISPDDKDDKFRLIDTLLWEVPEVGATTRRADIESLKAFLTLRNIKERKSYGRHPINKPVICNFIGSVNPDGAGFLNDPTGSTRFLCCTIEAIDFSYTTQPVKQLWAEAFWFWQNTPNAWELTPMEKERQRQINAAFEMVSALEEALNHWFDITLDEDDFMTTQEIKTHLIGHYNIGNENGFFRELSRILHRLGVSKSRKNYQEGQPHLRGWGGIKRRTFLENLN